MIGMVIVWFLLLALGLLVVTQLFPHPGREDRRAQDSPTALEILRRRYARGELSQEQYALMLRDLTDDKPL